MTARVLMVQGTSSSVGKSLLAAALCRIFARRGMRVAPFKAQNMSNNAAVCADGAEIGRAQAVQAAAAGVEPTADMNPVLLKPEADARSQVIVLGRPWRTLRAGSFYRRKDELWPIVTAALDRLRSAHDLIVIEGAGSPVELNLRSSDIVNMALACHARAPVLLVGDIDRGGIFAQLLGTLMLLPPEERGLVQGLVVNRFRGDPALFADGIRMLEERGGVPVLGVVPHFSWLLLPEEDSVALDAAPLTPDPSPPRGEGSPSSSPRPGFGGEGLGERGPSSSPRPLGGEGSGVRGPAVDIAVVRLPHIANFDDFDPLRAEAGVNLRYVQSPAALGRPHAVVLPGTKSTLADLAWLRAAGFTEALRELASHGTSMVGICGGYQMLGRVVRDPTGVESSTAEAPGLGLLPVETTFESAKATFQARAHVRGGPGWLGKAAGLEVEGYEIHVGRTASGCPWLEITHRNGAPAGLPDGAASEDGRVWGCYLHGLFANAGLRRLWLASLAETWEAAESPAASLHAMLDRLADAVAAALDMQRLAAILATHPRQPFLPTPENGSRYD
jgi:adenosylcobyric acid synthase